MLTKHFKTMKISITSHNLHFVHICLTMRSHEIIWDLVISCGFCMFEIRKKNISEVSPPVRLNFKISEDYNFLSPEHNNPPEEGVMLHTHLPQLLGCLVIRQFEANCTLKLFHLLKHKPQRLRSMKLTLRFHSWIEWAQWTTDTDYRQMNVCCCESRLYLRWSYFDEEAAAFVWDLEDFGPRETIDPQFVFVDHQTTGANPQHDVNTIQILVKIPRERQFQKAETLWGSVVPPQTKRSVSQPPVSEACWKDNQHPCTWGFYHGAAVQWLNNPIWISWRAGFQSSSKKTAVVCLRCESSLVLCVTIPSLDQEVHFNRCICVLSPVFRLYLEVVQMKYNPPRVRKWRENR